LEVLKKVNDFLKDGKMLSALAWDEEEKKIIKSYQLLSSKPRLYLLNGEEKDVPAETMEVFRNNSWPYMFMDVLTESESGDMSKEERESFGLPSEPKLNELIKDSYNLLGLITFLTTGPDETRAWTIHKGDKAPQAGGAIHTDFEETFIRAEVINWEKLIECGGFAGAREKGMIRTEGKEYVVSDGDVIEIKSGK
jgi:ribosome-binding ATPase